MSQPPPYGTYQYQQPPHAGWAPPPGEGYPNPPPGQGFSGQPPMPPPMPHMMGPGMGGPAYDGGESGEAKYSAQIQFSDKSIRAGFIRKVFTVLTIMLAVVAVIVTAFHFIDGAKDFVLRSGWGMGLYWGSYVCFLVTYLALACCEGVRRSFPTNVICLVILTLAISFMTVMITLRYETPIVFLAMGICAACSFAIILFSMQTKYDFTSCMGVMFVIFMVVFLFGIVSIVCTIFWPQLRFLYLIYAGLMALVFMVYLAIDTQLVMGGKKHEISQEDWVFAAIQLFMDIIYIFWFLLQLIGGSSN